MVHKEVELKDLPEQKMVTQLVFDVENIVVGSVIKHYNVDVETDTARVLRVGVVTDVDNYFLSYSAYSPEEEQMKGYSIHYTEVYVPKVNVATDGKFMSAYEILEV